MKSKKQYKIQKQYPEHKKVNPCRCRNGHIFNYADRIRFDKNDMGFAPCQGKCPYCGNISFAQIK